MKTYFRVVDTKQELPGYYSTKSFSPPNRKRYHEVLPYLELVTRYSLLYNEPIFKLLNPILLFSDSPDHFYQSLGADKPWAASYCNEFFSLGILSNPFSEIDFPLIWQLLWEQVRAREFPNLPSRQKAVMLWRSREEADRFMQNERDDFDDIDVVEVLIPDSAEPQAYDMSWLDAVPTSATAAEAMQYANKYWMQEARECPIWEILYYGEYVIVPR